MSKIINQNKSAVDNLKSTLDSYIETSKKKDLNVSNRSHSID
jgi:hypothetical protein